MYITKWIDVVNKVNFRHFWRILLKEIMYWYNVIKIKIVACSVHHTTVLFNDQYLI